MIEPSVLKRPRLRIQPWAAGVFCRYRMDIWVIQRRQVSAVVDQGIAHTEGRPSDITRAMDPVRIGRRRRRCPDVDMDVGTVRMLDHAAVNIVRALVHPNYGLRVHSEMQAVKIIDRLADTFNHRSHETAQSIRLISALNLPNPTVFNRQMNRFGQIGGYADVPRPPAEHPVKHEDAGGL